MLKRIMFVLLVLLFTAGFALANGNGVEFGPPGYYQKYKGGNVGMIQFFKNGHPIGESEWMFIGNPGTPDCGLFCADAEASGQSSDFNFLTLGNYSYASSGYDAEAKICRFFGPRDVSVEGDGYTSRFTKNNYGWYVITEPLVDAEAWGSSRSVALNSIDVPIWNWNHMVMVSEGLAMTQSEANGATGVGTNTTFGVWSNGKIFWCIPFEIHETWQIQDIEAALGIHHLKVYGNAMQSNSAFAISNDNDFQFFDSYAMVMGGSKSYAEYQKCAIGFAKESSLTGAAYAGGFTVAEAYTSPDGTVSSAYGYTTSYAEAMTELNADGWMFGFGYTKAQVSGCITGMTKASGFGAVASTQGTASYNAVNYGGNYTTLSGYALTEGTSIVGPGFASSYSHSQAGTGTGNQLD